LPRKAVEQEKQRALDLAYRALGRRERTVVELRAYLEGKRVEPGAIDDVVAELKENGFLDDAGFAQRFAEDKRTLERWGSERIERDLRRRGVPSDLVAAAVGSHDRDDELGAALALLAQRVPDPPSDARERDRAWRMLVRKGYEPELAYEAVRAHGRQSRAA
jgi:regulatory protein